MALALAAATGAVGAPSPTDGTLRVGDIAPDFTLEALDGTPLCLGDCLGEKPVLIVFWSYFCFPCQREMPAIEALHRELGPDRVTVLGVSLDGPRYDDKVRPFLAENGITFPNAYDRETEAFFEVAERFGVVGTPTFFLLDASGRVRLIHLGRLEPDVLRGVIRGINDPTFCSEIVKPGGVPEGKREP